MDFYVETLNNLVGRGKLDRQATTLVIAGGPKDREAFLNAGFSDVTISNLDRRMQGHEFDPYLWAPIDAENIALPDCSFDQVIDHMGLHHCGSPHRALLEMYRVARKAVLVFENRDSFTLRTAVRLGLVPEYELDAVRGNGYEFGGWRNTAIPNHVYRWTEAEVIKTIASADPANRLEMEFFYNLRYPDARIGGMNNPLRLILLALKIPFKFYARLFPRQANEFGFFLNKADRKPHPWIDSFTGTLIRG